MGKLTSREMANAMNLGSTRPPIREWVVQHLLAHHWLYAMKKKFFNGINLHFENVSLAEDEGKTEYRRGKESKDRSGKRLPPWPQQELTKLEPGK